MYLGLAALVTEGFSTMELCTATAFQAIGKGFFGMDDCAELTLGFEDGVVKCTSRFGA